MKLRHVFACLLLALAAPAMAQDAKSVIANASKAMGLDGVNALYYYGSGRSYSIGQNNNANIPWPQTPLNDWVRAIDFAQPAMRTTWNTYAIPVTGGAATLQKGQQNVTPAQAGNWNLQLEIWTTPWGFIKGAAAAGNASVKTENVAGKPYRVVTWSPATKSPGGQSYKVMGWINADNLVTKVNTWVEHNIFGDLLVESEYSFYREINGLKFPTEMVQRRAGWPVFDVQILAAWPNPPKLAELMAMPAPPAGAGGPPGGPGGAAAAAQSEKLADGIYRIKGAYNSLAVEMADQVLLIEPGPQSEARALAGIAETRRLFPGKPIKFGVITHHHFDHTGGIAAVAAEGITIVTPVVNKAFLEKALSGPRTLAPDALAKSGKKAVVEGFAGDKRVFQDATRTVEIHVIKGLPHADGLVIAWLPKEKILVYADMFNFPAANDPVPNPPVIGTRVFLENLQRLGIESDKILSIHTMNPDRLATMQDIKSSMGIAN
jgi:glyoxylase-like metal-dependent hydrolase (beta-lactamase superfamily II)